MNVLMLLKCNGLAYDDRVRKEVLSLSKFDYLTEILVLENDNSSGQGSIFSGKAQYKKMKLFTRKIFKGNSFLFIKLLEFFFKILPRTFKKREVVWLHDPLMFIFVPYFYCLKKLGIVDKLIWDQHELPPENFLNNPILCFLYKLSMKLADVRIHANRERAEYLNKILKHNFDFVVLRNFVDEELRYEVSQKLSFKLEGWLKDDGYILLQSGGAETRNFTYVAESICTNVYRKCVVVGAVDDKYINSLRKKHPNFDDYFYFVGMVPQIRLVDYIDKADVSLILYNVKHMNSELCEPNRLYQAITRGLPVIVGNNPPMKHIVKTQRAGVIIHGDGSLSCHISKAINEFYQSKIKITPEVRDMFSWDLQQNVFEDILNS